MASITMSASILAAAQPSPTGSRPSLQRRLVVANASRVVEGQRKVNYEREEGCNGRRNLMIAAAAAAVSSVAGMALADEPKPGTPEAKKKYAPICVTMPTARICHK